MSKEEEEQEEELFPENIRIIGFWTSLIFSGILIAYYVAYIYECVEASPKDLGLSSLLLFSLACFFFFAIPWHKLGLSLKKFGPIEFEKRLDGQSEEHIRDISEIEKKISQLESTVYANGKIKQGVIAEPSPREKELRELILKFLSEYDRWSFSPLRIEEWGADRPGYSKLAGDPSLLRSLLRALVAEGRLETRVSKKGNTLYRYKQQP